MRIDANDKGVTGRYRVFLDGADISGDCVVADDQEGWAHCIVRTAEGHVVAGADGINPDKEMRYGTVEIVDTKAVERVYL